MVGETVFAPVRGIWVPQKYVSVEKWSTSSIFCLNGQNRRFGLFFGLICTAIVDILRTCGRRDRSRSSTKHLGTSGRRVGRKMVEIVDFMQKLKAFYAILSMFFEYVIVISLLIRGCWG